MVGKWKENGWGEEGEKVELIINIYNGWIINLVDDW